MCLHTLKYLYDITLEGGITVGFLYMQQVRKNNTYNTVLEGCMSDVFDRLKELMKEVQKDKLMDHPKLGILRNILLQEHSNYSSTKEDRKNGFRVLIFVHHKSVIPGMLSLIKETAGVFSTYVIEYSENLGEYIIRENDDIFSIKDMFVDL